MALPIKNGKMTTLYKKKGKHWSKGYHTGVDFAVPEGTEVFAVADGIIDAANWGKSYGKQVVQKVFGGFCIYAHLSEVFVKAGHTVLKGELIGKTGNTGNSTGPHLHFEYRDKRRWSEGTDLDPHKLLVI
jgi:murein DD-endopeptidase MepM/ murein hydrolase activator NlpD